MPIARYISTDSKILVLQCPVPKLLVWCFLSVAMLQQTAVKCSVVTDIQSNIPSELNISEIPYCPDDSYFFEWQMLLAELRMPVRSALLNDSSSSSEEIISLEKSEHEMLDQVYQNKQQHNDFWAPDEKLQEEFVPDNLKSYQLKNQTFGCSTSKISYEFHWHPLWAEKIKLKYNFANSRFSYFNISLLDDILVWNKAEYERYVFRNPYYCLSRYTSDGWVSFKACRYNCSDTNPCIRKCCPPTKVLNSETRQCVLAKTSWSPTFYANAEALHPYHEQLKANASTSFGLPNCSPKYFIKHEKPTNHFKLLVNGKIALINGMKRDYINAKDFCVDGLHYVETEVDKDAQKDVKSYSGSEWNQVVIACKPKKENGVRYLIYSVLNQISALFLLMTDIVYILLWRTWMRNIHGWLQFAYTTSLFFTFNCISIGQMWANELNNASKFSCKVLGWIAHVTYLSSFFWLTSMNFDLFWRFSRPLTSTIAIARPLGSKWRRFVGFAIFSIGIPLGVLSIGITLDYIYGDNLVEPPVPIPRFGKDTCYFEDKRSQVPYIYGPAGVLLIIDLVFFLSTVVHLRKIHAHTELARTQSTIDDKRGLRIIAKLVIVMGVLWIFELTSWIVHLLLPNEEKLLNLIFIPVDVLNSLQGVAIFIIFVCKPSVGSQLYGIFYKEPHGIKSWNKQTPLSSLTVMPNKVNDQAANH